MRKIQTMVFIAMMIISALVSITSVSTLTLAEGPNQPHPEKQNATLYMYGPGKNITTSEDHYEFMNTTRPVNETPTEYSHQDEGLPFPAGPRSGDVSRWYSEPLEKDIEINGIINMSLFAKGDVLDVVFHIRFYQMDDVGQENRIGDYQIDTNQDTLDEDYAKLFNGTINLTGDTITINKGIKFGIDISYDGDSTDVFTNTPNNRNVTLCYASSITEETSTERGPSALVFQCNSINVDVNEITKNFHKEYLLISSSISSAFGGPMRDNENFTDIAEYFINITGPVEGKSFDETQDMPLYINYDNTTKETITTYQWNYGQDHILTGDYWINISIRDKSGNWWVGFKDIFIDINEKAPDVDFSIPRIPDNITFQVGGKDVNTLYVDEYVEIWIKTFGIGDESFFGTTGGLIKMSIYGTEIGNPDVIEFTEEFSWKILEGETEDYIVWKPTETGDFNFKVTLDPENDIIEDYQGENYDDENNTGWFWKGSGKGEITITDRKSPIAQIDSPSATITHQTEGNSIELTFDGSSSDSGNDDDIDTWKWELDGEEIGNTETFDHEFDFNDHEHRVKLTVTNTDEKEDSKLITIKVNSKPDAIINKPSDAAIFEIDQEISFESGSTDNEGDSITYLWNSNIDGELSTEMDFDKSLTEGEHTITLEIDDGHGGKDETTISLTVGEGNLAPEAIILSPSNNDKFDLGKLITFDASSSTDPNDGDNLTYTWESDNDGPIGEGEILTYNGLTLNTHEITLTVEDPKGATDETSVIIEIISPIPEPVIKSGGQTSSVTVEIEEGKTVTVPFSAESSTNIDYIASYNWDFGDGNTEVTSITTVDHEYTEEGTYVVKLTIIDNNGNQDSDTMTVEITLKDDDPGNGGDDDDDDWMIYAGIGGAVVAVIIIGLVFATRKGKDEWDDDKWDEEEEW